MAISSAPGAMAETSTRGAPTVSVPVLSKATASTSARRSMAEPSFIMMPASKSRRAATTCTMGTARPSAHGQVMMSTAMAMLIAWCQSPVATIQPRKVSNAAKWTTGE
ncbi:MAG: hypothetical protein ABS57_21730 [Mesorhizobium sp. SCN 65-12]|nr:MAG: hypothetical protein ABS57_21730 [Mesorhizobium sp. SCN 65-12]